MTWSAKQYTAFEDERTRPVRDLLAAVPDIEARSVIDLGCGPGNSTEVLAARFPDAVVQGLDSSSDMIAAARRRLPQVQFAISGIEEWKDAGPFDVILANAVMQWVPDHAHVLPALVSKLGPGGALAVQMPDNLDVPAHRLMRETAAAGPWATATGSGRGEPHRHRQRERLLRNAAAGVQQGGCVADHLSSPAGGRGRGNRGMVQGQRLAAVPGAARCAITRGLLERYTTAVARAYPASPDGAVLLPFPRLFVVAIR